MLIDSYDMRYTHKKMALILCMVIFVMCADCHARNIVIADSLTKMPLPKASIYNRKGKAVGISNSRGVLPKLLLSEFPVTIRYIGYRDKVLNGPAEWSLPGNDTIFLREEISELPEVVVKLKNARVLHMLAYVREVSSLATYTDTVFLFREKMVDYMLLSDDKIKFRGWSNPRTLTCKSYYRFTNSEGLDSVSDECNNHFSWTDWMGVCPDFKLPSNLKSKKVGTDTVMGKYYAEEIWNKRNDSVLVDVNVLAGSNGRRWVPTFNGFFHKNLDFEKFNVSYVFENVEGDNVTPLELNSYSFDIESRGRGRDMFRFNRYNEPVFVTTAGSVYFLDKEFISVKEARKWEGRKFDVEEVGIFEPFGVPELQAEVVELIARVNSVDKESVRVDVKPDQRLVGIKSGRNNFAFGRRALNILKTLTGISRYKSNKNFKRNWNNMRKKLKK